MSHKIVNKLVVYMAFAIILMSDLAAQEFGRNSREMANFNYDIAVFPNLTSSKMKADVFVWLRNDQIQHVMKDSVFQARYQINLSISKKDENLAILTKDSTFVRAVSTYRETIDPDIQHLHQFTYMINPGDYEFEIRVFDFNSEKSMIRSIKKRIRPLTSKDIYLSDIVLLDTPNLDTLTADNILSPQRIPIQDTIYLYLELVKPDNMPSYSIEALLQRNNENRRFAFRNDFKSASRSTVVMLELLKENMAIGLNEIVVTAKSGNLEKQVSKRVFFLQTSISGDIIDTGSLGEMVEQLEYVARGDEWRDLMNAEEGELEQVFRKFWELRDPTPGTPENQLFDEYYKRVRIANNQFDTPKRDGWRSDKGRIFIIYGPPDSIEKSDPFATSFGAYEIWYYEEIKERFVFYDEYGFGDYRLISNNY
ncbi:GWxTD domain-containing protein [candidate division KSB1 bacterium]|nr:GWxTD domain-containing protein [candidate division KSB1 bacterium]